MQVRTRNQISTTDIRELKKDIDHIVQDSKNSHTGIFSFLQSDVVITAIENLQITVNKMIDDVDMLAFKKYVKILQALNNYLISTNKEKHDSIAKIKKLLIDNLIHLQDAQYIPKENIDNSLKLLEKVATDEQDFYDKWLKRNVNALGMKNDFPIWGQLLLTINERLDDKHELTLIADLKGMLGFKEESLVANFKDNNYVNNEETRNKKEVGHLPAIIRQANSELIELEKCRGMLSSESVKNIIEELSKPDNFKISLVRRLVKKHNKNSLGERVKGNLKIIEEKLAQIDDILDPYIDKDKLDQLDELDKDYELKKQGLRDEVTINQLEKNEADRVQFLKEVIESLMKPVQEDLSFRIQIDNLLNIIREYDKSKSVDDSFVHVKKIITAIKQEKTQYIREGSTGRLFSSKLYEAVEKLEYQMEIMSVDNLLTLATDYMRHYVEDNLASYEKEREYVDVNFLQHLIKNVIDPIRSVFGKNPLDDNLSDRFEFRVKQIIKDYIKILNVTKAEEACNAEEELKAEGTRMSEEVRKAEETGKANDTKYNIPSPHVKQSMFVNVNGNPRPLSNYEIFKRDIHIWKQTIKTQDKKIDYPSYEKYKEEKEHYLVAKKEGRLHSYFNFLFSIPRPSTSVEIMKLRPFQWT